MKKIIFTTLAFALFFIFSSCGTTDAVEPEKPAEAVEEPLVLNEEPEVMEVEESEEDKEYERSTTNVSVTKETFNEDKARILKIIEDLDIYMRNGDFKGWYSYLDEESAQYWTLKPNLTKAASRLPKKGLKLKSIEDYFRFVFIPARKGHKVDEIRYDSETEVKVVEVEDDKDTVYYNFHKINDKWKLSIPKNPD